MDIHTLLKIKLKNDLKIELEKEYRKLNLNISKEEYIRIIENKLNDKIENIDISLDNNKPIKEIENQCCARIMCSKWRNSDSRCTHQIHGGDYCKKHLRRINKHGFLSFGRYDEKRPEINENGNKIMWRDQSPMEDINTVIQYQSNNFINIIKKST